MNQRARARMFATTATMILAAIPIRACPWCVSDTGKQVRAGIFGADFGANLIMMLLPFGVFLTIAALMHHGLPWSKPRPTEAAPTGADGEART